MGVARTIKGYFRGLNIGEDRLTVWFLKLSVDVHQEFYTKQSWRCGVRAKHEESAHLQRELDYAIGIKWCQKTA